VSSDLAGLLLERNLAFVERGAGEVDLALLREDAEANAVRCLAIARRVRDAIALANGRPRVLELGIGYAYQTTTLRSELGHAFDLHAVDHPRRRYLDQPQFARLLEEQRVVFARCDLLRDELPWPELRFDAIIFADVIEHLPPTEVPRLLAELRGRLAPRGRLIATSTNLPAFYRIATLALGNGLVLDPPHPLDAAPDTYGHIRLYGRADVDILLERAGLRLVDWQFGNWELVYVPRETAQQRLARAAQRVLPRLVPRWSTSWLVAAERAQMA